MNNVERKNNWEEGRPRPDTHYFLSREDAVIIHGAKLPHWNQEGKYVFFTFRLSDSLPKEKQEDLKLRIHIWEANHPKPWSEIVEKEYHRLFTRKIEELLDNGFGSCILRNVEAIDIVEQTMKYNDGSNYELIDYVIMSNHVHALVRLYDGCMVEDLMQEWKSVSSHRLRKIYGEDWCGWMEKYHDRHIRNELHFDNVIRYIYKNWWQSGGRAAYSGGMCRGEGAPPPS